jgi:pyrophosphatase PpaX
MHEPLRVVLFDLDGTLLDSQDQEVLIMTRLFCTDLGLKLNEQEIASYRGVPSREVLEQLASRPAGSCGAGLTLAPDRVEELLSTWLSYHEATVNQTPLFPGVLETLHTLSQAGLALGVVTGQSRAELDASRRHIDLDSLIDVWVAADDTPFAKPHPAPVRLAIETMGCRPDQAVMIGDSRFDMEAGRQAGTRLGAALWGARDPGLLLDFDPDYVFEHPRQIQNLLCGTKEKGDAQ